MFVFLVISLFIFMHYLYICRPHCISRDRTNGVCSTDTEGSLPASSAGDNSCKNGRCKASEKNVLWWELRGSLELRL